MSKDNLMNLFEHAQYLYTKSIADTIDDSDIKMIIDWPLESLSVLFAVADQLRHHFCGTIADPCSIMNVKSGGCSEDCAFCAQSAHSDTSVNITGLADPEDIKKQLAMATAHHLPFCVVSSGRRLTTEEVSIICSALRNSPGEKHASLGILNSDEFSMLADAGVVCYNHNLETNHTFFPNIVSTHTWEERADTVRRAKAAGLHICCGGIFGLGETWEDRAAFAKEVKALAVDSIPINFFNPVPGTRVKRPNESPLEFLKIVSLFRLVLPSKTIKVCGGREYHLGPLQSLLFYAGANGYISGGYLTTKGAGVDADDRLIDTLGLQKRIQ